MYSFLRSCRVAGAILTPRPRSGWQSLVVLVAACVFAAEPVAEGASPARGTLAMVDRTVTQDQGAWVIDYRLRHTGATGVVVTPEEIGVKVEGWVSNSRVASHAVPRWSSLVIARGPELSTASEVIASADESQRCRERMLVSIRADDPGSSRNGPGDRVKGAAVPASVSARPRMRSIFRPSCRSAWARGPSSGSGSGSNISTSSTAISTRSWPSEPSS